MSNLEVGGAKAPVQRRRMSVSAKSAGMALLQSDASRTTTSLGIGEEKDVKKSPNTLSSFGEEEEEEEEETRVTTKGAAMAVMAALKSQPTAFLKQANKDNQQDTEDSINREVKLVEEKKMGSMSSSGKIGKIKGLDKLINMNPLPTSSSNRYPPVAQNSAYNDSLDTNIQSQNVNSVTGPMPSAAPTQADLDGFPVIRIDQIPDVNSRMLEASLEQIPALLKQMHDEATMKQQAVPKFAYYLQKQIDAMRSELMKRAAEKRVFSILEGSSDIFSDYNSIISSSTNEKIERLRNSYEMKKAAIPEEGPVPASLMTSNTLAPPIDIYPASTQLQQQQFQQQQQQFQQQQQQQQDDDDEQMVVAGVQKSQPGFPYRSTSATVRASSPIELKSNRSVLSATTRREMASMSPSKLSPVAPVVAKDNPLFNVQATNNIPNTYVSNTLSVDEAMHTNDGTLPASPFNAINYNASMNAMDNTDSRMNGHVPIDSTRGPDRMTVAEKNELMGLDDPAISMTTKNVTAKVDSNNSVNKSGWGGRSAGEKALQVVYKNFGSEFVVAATEKKRRLFPIKKKTESEDERREREKKERREAAMKRLMKRKEKIEKDNLRKREQKLIQQAEKMKLRDEQNQAKEVEGFFPARNKEGKNSYNRARRGKESHRVSGSVTARDSKANDEKMTGTNRDKKRSRNRTAPASVSVEADEEADESEESVSGGEEELPMPVNEQLVEHVKEAICEAVLEESREQRSSPRVSNNNRSPPFNALRHARPPSDDEFEKSFDRKREKKKKDFNARHHKRTSPQSSPSRERTIHSPKKTANVQSKQRARKVVVSDDEDEELESDSQILGRSERSPSVAKLALAMALSKMEETAKAQADGSSTPSPAKAAVYVQTSTERLMSKAKEQERHMSPIQKLQLNKAKALEKKSRIPRPQKPARGLRAIEKLHAAAVDDSGNEEGYSAVKNKSPQKKGKYSPVTSPKKSPPKVPALDLSASQILETNMEDGDDEEEEEDDEEDRMDGDGEHEHTFRRTDSEALMGEDEIDAKIAALESELMLNGGNRLKREESKKKLQMEIDLMRNAGNSTTFEAKLMVSNIISTALNSPRLSPRQYQQEQKELSALHTHVKHHDTHHDKLLQPHPPQVDLNVDIENKSRAAVDIVRQLKLKRTMSQQKMADAQEGNNEKTAQPVDDKNAEAHDDDDKDEKEPPTFKGVALATKASISTANMVKNQISIDTSGTISGDGDVSVVIDNSQVEEKSNVRSPRSIREPKISPRVRKPIKAPEKRQPVPLIELRDNVYFCAYGPDELPGLRVWTLEELHDDGSASWDFNMELYFKPPPDNEQLTSLRVQRTALRRTVSKGLIILAKDCESLLRGTQFAQNEEQFTNNWTSALKKFDNQVESMGAAAKDMFSQVDVCGNCHAVCRKLENLIKTYFARMLSNVEEEQNNEAIIEAVQRSISGTNDDNAIANGGRKSPISPVQELSVDNKEEEHFVTDTGMFNKHIHGDDDLLGNRSHETPRTVVPAIDDDTNGIDDDNGNEDDNDGDGDDGEKEDEGVFLNEAAMNTDSAEHQVDGMLTAEDVGLENEAQQEAEYDKDGNENLTRVKTEEDQLRDLAVLVEDTITKIDDHDHEDVETREYTEMGSDMLDHREDFAEISAAAARAAKDVADLNENVVEADDGAEHSHPANNMALDDVKRTNKKDIFAAEEGEEYDDDDDESMLLPTDVYLPSGGLGDDEDDDDDDGIGYDDDTADVEDISPHRNNSKTSLSIPGEVDKTLTPEQVYAMEARKERMSAVIEASPVPTIDMMSKHSVWYRNKNIPVPLSPKHASSSPNRLEDHELAITELYNHIGMIFPVSYSTSGPRNAEHVDARALVECMQQQVHLYNEWMEVMSDYATVFSDDRGVSKHGKKENEGNSSPGIYEGGSQVLHYRVKSSRPEVYDIVTDVFNSKLKHTWEELPQGLGLGVSWNLLWTWSKPRLNMSHLLVWQKVNHFVDSKQLTRKDLLKKNLQRFTDMSGKVAEAFEIMPQTFVLPHEYTALVRTFHDIENSKYLQEDPIQNVWIVKPVGMSRGRGIELIRDVNDLAYGSQTVVQRYLEHPLLLDGYKFDLRLYVCVTSFKPLEAFIYKEGFARVSTTEYSYHVDDIDNKFIHLTNASIQRENKDNIHKGNPTMQGSENIGGSKIPLHGPHGLWQRLEALDLDVDLIWRNICLCVTKSLVVVDEKMSYQPNCFEVFGYDIILDKHLKPWLLEVNASPSMSRETALDVRVKNNMIQDTITLIDPAPYDRAAVAKVIKRRLNDLNKNKFNMKSNDPHLEGDLRSILGDHRPRQIGEDPPQEKLGDYQKLCPNTKIHAHVLKLKGKIIKPLQQNR